MLWSAFSYDKKGPCHCWALDTAKEKNAANGAFKKLNNELEPVMGEQRELTNA